MLESSRIRRQERLAPCLPRRLRRRKYGIAQRNCRSNAPNRGGVTTPNWSIADRSSRVAQCSASLPSATRNQWLWAYSNSFPLGGKEAVQSSHVRASRTHASDDEVAIGNNGLDLEGQVRKLGDQPLHSSSHRGRSFHATRCTHGEWSSAVLNEVLSHQLVTSRRVSLVPDLFEVPANKVHVFPGHHSSPRRTASSPHRDPHIHKATSGFVGQQDAQTSAQPLRITAAAVDALADRRASQPNDSNPGSRSRQRRRTGSQPNQQRRGRSP